jgi:hypothetical protein
MSSCNDVFWLAISRASSAASSTATSTAAKIRELDDIPMVLSSAFHFVLNALRKSETHLYLAVHVARGNLHVSGIHSLYIQRGQPLNGFDQLGRVAPVHIRPADVPVRKDGVSGEEHLRVLLVEAEAAQGVAGGL